MYQIHIHFIGQDRITIFSYSLYSQYNTYTYMHTYAHVTYFPYASMHSIHMLTYILTIHDVVICKTYQNHVQYDNHMKHQLYILIYIHIYISFQLCITRICHPFMHYMHIRSVSCNVFTFFIRTCIYLYVTITYITTRRALSGNHYV